MQKTFVIDKAGRPCLPCHSARSRKLLREEKSPRLRIKWRQVAKLLEEIREILPEPTEYHRYMRFEY